MDPRVSEAARTGNIDVLYTLIQQDPYLFEGIDKIPFVDTPLHISAFEGQINFAMEMMNLKPSFARKLNQEGLSPMHQALRKGHTKLLLRLLKTDKDLLRVKGREGMTPFHCVVTMGNSNLLVEFLEACPECIEDVTVQGETALHLALKSDQIEAFNLLIGWLQTNVHGSCFEWERKIVNWRDNDYNTVLHIAVIKQQHQALKLLLDSFLLLDVKAKNWEGSTALEIVQNVEQQSMNSGENDTKIKHLKKKVSKFEKILVDLSRTKNSMSIEVIKIMLVITGLVIAAIYQIYSSLRDLVWPGDNRSSMTGPSSAAYQYFLAHEGNRQFITKYDGSTIMDPELFLSFWFVNCTTLASTILLIAFLLSSVPQFIFILTPLFLLGISFFFSMVILCPSITWFIINGIFMLIFEYMFLTITKRCEIKGQLKDRTYFRTAIGMGKNIGIIQHLARAIMFRKHFFLVFLAFIVLYLIWIFGFFM